MPNFYFQSGLECHVSDGNIRMSLLMYASYFVLFGRFFYVSYVKKKLNAAAVKGQTENDKKAD
jgi:hypothetical protein